MDGKKYKVIILGAVFSKPAGLPLVNELWSEILKRAKNLWGRAGKFNDDLNAYIDFRRNCDGKVGGGAIIISTLIPALSRWQEREKRKEGLC